MMGYHIGSFFTMNPPFAFVCFQRNGELPPSQESASETIPSKTLKAPPVEVCRHKYTVMVFTQNTALFSVLMKISFVLEYDNRGRGCIHSFLQSCAFLGELGIGYDQKRFWLWPKGSESLKFSSQGLNQCIPKCF